MKKIILAALAVAAFGAQAADEGAYVGLNYGNYKLSCDDCSGSESAVGFYGGYRMGNLAAEISRAQKTVDGVKFIYTDVAVIPRMNVAKDLDVIGKVGLRHSEISDSTDKFSGNSLVVGAGVEYAIMPQVLVRGMIDYSTKTFGESTKATTTTIGVAYKF
jgi:opacity protein-like surface antigen